MGLFFFQKKKNKEKSFNKIMIHEMNRWVGYLYVKEGEGDSDIKYWEYISHFVSFMYATNI